MSVFIPIPEKGNAKECSNYSTVALISHLRQVSSHILLDVDHFEVFTEFVTVLLLMFMFWCFDHAACGFYLPRD